VFDTDMRILWVNRSLADLCDIPGERWVGRRLGEMLPGSGLENVESMLRHVLETGERVTNVERPGPLLFQEQFRQVWGCSGFQIKQDDGEVIGVALMASDATRRSHDKRRLALLNEASEKIGSTLDLARTAEETLDMLVPRVGDAAHINLLSYVLEGEPQPSFEPGGEQLRMLVTAVRWLSGQPVPEQIQRGAVSYLDPGSLYYQRLSEGRTIFEPNLEHTSPDFELLLRDEFFARRFMMVQKVGIKGGMIVPISARGVVLGTVAVFRARDPEITWQEVALTQDVLARSAICLDNARVYSRERTIALELQRSMLPQSIGAVPGLDLAYRYEPANVASEIGGDWFDVVHQANGCIALIVGDVTGHDIHAASLMGQIRTVTRTLATLDLSPVEVLTRLDAMISDMGSEVGATCVYAAFSPDTRRCVIARAGHPPPALAQPTGSVEFLEMPAGLPLGVGGGDFESVAVDLEPGAVLVLYTDGLIESRDSGIDVGMDNLARALTENGIEPFGHRYAASLINRLVPDPADDIALLAARITGHAA
jgi:hypothetical protein